MYLMYVGRYVCTPYVRLIIRWPGAQSLRAGDVRRVLIAGQRLLDDREGVGLGKTRDDCECGVSTS